MLLHRTISTTQSPYLSLPHIPEALGAKSNMDKSDGVHSKASESDDIAVLHAEAYVNINPTSIATYVATNDARLERTKAKLRSLTNKTSECTTNDDSCAAGKKSIVAAIISGHGRYSTWTAEVLAQALQSGQRQLHSLRRAHHPSGEMPTIPSHILSSPLLTMRKG